MINGGLNADAGVRFIVRGIDASEKAILYEHLYRLKRFQTPNLAWWYVLAWIGVLFLILATSFAWADSNRALLIAMTLVPAYRAFDVLRWYADFLLDKRHNHVLSPERNLLFVVVNLVEATLIGAIWLRASGAVASAGSAAYRSFALVTQLELPAVAGGWAKAAVVVTEVMALTLLFGGVAVLIAEVQRKVASTGTWRGRSIWGD